MMHNHLLSDSTRWLTRTMAVGLLALSLGGCFHSTFLNGGDGAGAPSPMYTERWYHGAVLGLVDLSGPVGLDEVCPSGWTRIDTSTSFLNGIVEGLVGGLYSPQTVTIYCKGGQAFDAVRDDKGMVVAAMPHVGR